MSLTNTPLITALLRNKLKTALTLIKAGANVNTEGSITSQYQNEGSTEYCTPLSISIENDYLEILNALIAKKVDLSKKVNGKEPLVLAIWSSTEITNILLTAGAKKSIAALMAASGKGARAIVKSLIKGRTSEDVESYHKALIVASANGHLDIVKIFIDLEVDLNRRNDNEYVYAGPSLLESIKYGHKDVALALIDAGAAVNGCDEFGNSPLNEAIESGDEELVDILIKNGAKVN